MKEFEVYKWAEVSEGLRNIRLAEVEQDCSSAEAPACPEDMV